MLPWLTLAALVLSVALSLALYLRSVRPAAREPREGPGVWQRCARERGLSVVFLCLAAASCVAYRLWPLELPLPDRLPWPPWITWLVAAILILPGLSLVALGLHAAGRETMSPRRETRPFRGIYRYVRHPQSGGALLAWLGFMLVLDSPLLALLAIPAVPFWMMTCHVEERDLLLRFGPLCREGVEAPENEKRGGGRT